MKTVTLNLLKKNRVWIDCKTESGYSCKLRSCELSKELELGVHILLIEDISVRSKYGIDLKFEMKSSLKQGICSFKPKSFNCWSTNSCKDLGGRWDHEEKSWIFSSLVSDKVDDLEDLYNGNFINVEISLKGDHPKTCCGDSVDFIGYPISIASSRDSGARLGHGVYLLSGKIDSGGSMKNWCSVVYENSVFRLSVSEKLFHENYNSEKSCWDAKILNEEGQ